MRKAIIVLLLATCALEAPAQHTVSLTCVDTDLPNVTISFYRGTGACNSYPAMVSITTGQTACAYTDSNVAEGKYCYAATAVSVNSGLESRFSNKANCSVVPNPPSNLGVSQIAWFIDVEVEPYPADEIIEAE